MRGRGNMICSGAKIYTLDSFLPPFSISKFATTVTLCNGKSLNKNSHIYNGASDLSMES